MKLHTINPKRIHTIHPGQNTSDVPGPVVYWMNRDMRIGDNWALLHAQNIAFESKRPLVIVYNLELGFLGGTMRSHDFKVKTLAQIHTGARKKSIEVCIVAGEDSHVELVGFFEKLGPATIVTDFFPLKISDMWQEYILEKYAKPNNVHFCEVDAHNIVPTQHVSDKQEFAARTIRPKLHKLLPEFLEDFPKLKKHPISFSDQKVLQKYAFNTSEDIASTLLLKKHIQNLRKDVLPVSWCIPGEDAAQKVLNDFLERGFEMYASDRNDPNLNSQSNLSVYFHYGNLSAQRVALEVVKKTEKPIQEILHAERNGASTENNAAAFLEELIVRKELSDNYCLHNKNYDNSKGLADWALKTLSEHAGDEREYEYTCEQWEKAQTHDELWNAAQNQMALTGKMHGYMRMYWAKKILEWSRNPDEAIKTAIYLNDTYSVDGRDPNGYCGILWSIGGLHDRAWFERPVYGKIRYMNANGCRKKFDVDAYIQKWRMGGGLF